MGTKKGKKIYVFFHIYQQIKDFYAVFKEIIFLFSYFCFLFPVFFFLLSSLFLSFTINQFSVTLICLISFIQLFILFYSSIQIIPFFCNCTYMYLQNQRQWLRILLLPVMFNNFRIVV